MSESPPTTTTRLLVVSAIALKYIHIFEDAKSLRFLLLSCIYTFWNSYDFNTIRDYCIQTWMRCVWFYSSFFFFQTSMTLRKISCVDTSSMLNHRTPTFLNASNRLFVWLDFSSMLAIAFLIGHLASTSAIPKCYQCISTIYLHYIPFSQLSLTVSGSFWS